MLFRICVTLVLTIGIYVYGYGQSTRDVAAPKPPAPKYQSFKKTKKKGFFYKLFHNKKHNQITGAEEKEEFEKRMKRTVRQKAKQEKISMQEQYQNPLYFGHKKPPKKRPPGKRKFCKECGIWH